MELRNLGKGGKLGVEGSYGSGKGVTRFIPHGVKVGVEGDGAVVNGTSIGKLGLLVGEFLNDEGIFWLRWGVIDNGYNRDQGGNGGSDVSQRWKGRQRNGLCDNGVRGRLGRRINARFLYRKSEANTLCNFLP
jgi:hypothetical protein